VDPRRSLTLADVLREHRRGRPQQLAAVDGAVRLTYPRLDERVNQLAHALRATGVAEGDRLLWLGQNSVRVLECLLAAAKLGAMFCPANWRQSTEEMAFVIDDFDAAVVVWQHEEIGDTVLDARDQSGSRARWLRHDAGPETGDSYEAFVAGGAPNDEDAFDGTDLADRFIGGLLHRYWLAAPEEAVGSDEQLGAAVFEPGGDRASAVTREDRREDGADPATGQRPDGALNGKRHEDPDAVTPADAERAERICRPPYLRQQCIVGDRTLLAILPFPDQREPITGSRRPSIDSRNGVVQPAIRKPRRPLLATREIQHVFGRV